MPLDEVVIVDADTNVVESPFDDVSQLPADAVSPIFTNSNLENLESLWTRELFVFNYILIS